MKAILKPVEGPTFESSFDLLADLNLICYSVVNDGSLRGLISCIFYALYCVHSCYRLLNTWSRDLSSYRHAL